jgi:hypothetical protein
LVDRLELLWDRKWAEKREMRKGNWTGKSWVGKMDDNSVARKVEPMAD